jgi:hypothetical protein
MPPSPSRRRSPSNETSHKRVNSFGNALPAKAKDDDLTLFTDMQKTEIENFLLEPSEDFDESICNAHRCPPPLYSHLCCISVISFCLHFFLLLWIPLCYVEALLVLTFFCSCISAKLSFFPDVKLGINVPVRGESSHDLLKVDGDKNDYEWYGHLISHVALFLFYVLVMNIFCFICSAIWYTSFAMFVLFTVYYT